MDFTPLGTFAAGFLPACNYVFLDILVDGTGLKPLNTADFNWENREKC